jgi:hypothetical protein
VALSISYRWSRTQPPSGKKLDLLAFQRNANRVIIFDEKSIQNLVAKPTVDEIDFDNIVP